MKIKRLEHYDKFDTNEYIFWLCIKNVPRKFVKQAKVIDGKNYNKDCFGVCVVYDGEWSVCIDNLNSELYYIDNNGNKHWLKYILNFKERNLVISFCQKIF